MSELKKNLVIKTRPKALEENVIIVKDYRFTVLTSNLIRVEKGQSFCDEATLTFFYRDTKKVDFTYEIKDSLIIIKTSEVSLFYDITKELKDNYVIFKNDSAKRLLNNDYNLKGTMRTLDATEQGGFGVYPWVTEFDIAHLPLGKGIMSRNGVAVIDDVLSPIVLENGQPAERKEEEIDSYLFLYLNDYKKALNEFYMISGYTPLIPRYVLGNWWSRYHPYTDKEYLALLDEFEYEQIPLSVATIDMDWHYIDPDTRFKRLELGLNDKDKYGQYGGWTGYTWNEELFPDYKKTLKEIHERNLYITLNLHPRDGIRWFESMYEEMATSMGKDPSTKEVIEFDVTDANYINNYFEKVIRPYENDGVDFWWIDYQQEPTTKIKNLDPLWALNHYHFLDSKNHLILSRYAELGSHRYPLGFSGDTKQTWDFLKLISYFTFTASNTGYTWWSHDIGAHHSGERDDDLYTRWIEFGVFSPINRIHSALMDVVSKEPWLTKKPIELITKEFLRLRHKLIPYIYNYSHLTHTSGKALIEPLYYESPNVDKAYKEESTYYFGELVVSPIISKTKDGYSIKTFYLPKGKYFDLFTKRWYKGGRDITVARDLGQIPVLIPESTILPLQNDISNGAFIPKDLDLNIISNKSKFILDESDENSSIIDSYRTKEKDGIIEFTISAKSSISFKRSYNLEFRYLLDGDVSVFVDGKECPFNTRHNNNLRVLVKDADINSNIKVIITNPLYETEEAYMKRQALYELTKYNEINEKKQVILDSIKEMHSLRELKEKVNSYKVKQFLKVILKEITLKE